MSSTSNVSICIHSVAEDTAYLGPVMTMLERHEFESFRLSDKGSENLALSELEKTSTAFVIIMAHGRSDCIYGGEYRDRIEGESRESTEIVNKDNLSLFNDKAVFCFSCGSESLGRKAMNVGAKAFVGFDKIGFEPLIGTNRTVTVKTKGIIKNSLIATFSKFIRDGLSLESAAEYLKLYLMRSAVDFVRTNRKETHRHEIARLLLEQKEGIRYYGPQDVYFSGSAG